MDNAALIASITKQVTESLVPTLVTAVKKDVLATLQPQMPGPSARNREALATLLPADGTLPTTALGISPNFIDGLAPDEVPRDQFHSRAIPLDLHVPNEVRGKILANKYVELDTLLPNPSVSNLALEGGTFQVVLP